MKITKRQLKRIIREEKVKLLREQVEMDPKIANAIQLLQTAYMNLDELLAGLDEEAWNEISAQMVLIEDAIIALGGVLP